MTTMEMTRAVLEAEGYRIIPSEFHCPGKRRAKGTQDFGGFADLIACHPGDILAIQHTEGMNNRGARIRKIKTLSTVWAWLGTRKARIEVWTWRELVDGWRLNRTELLISGNPARIHDNMIRDNNFDLLLAVL